MKIAKFMLASLLTVAIAGGTYASYIAKGPVKVYYKTTPTGQCNNLRQVIAASITNEDLPAGFSTQFSATITDAQPTACTLTVYYTPEQ